MNIGLEQAPRPRNGSSNIQNENLDKIKSSLRTEIMADLENHKEMFKLIARSIRKKNIPETVPDTKSEEENFSLVVPTSIPIKSVK